MNLIISNCTAYFDTFPILFITGDIVNFNYQENHNVEATTKEAFDGCVVGNNQPVNGPIAWTAPNEEGMTYVICGVSLHCELGNQKIAIQVSNSC